MKNKKGFTLIEIIICIGVLAIVGVVSFVGINTISKNIRINKLEDIEDTIMTAAKVYLETNKTSYQQLYNEQNAVVVPLGVLVNEGLLDLSMTDLKIEDIDKEYVVAALGTKTAGGKCVDITTETSWNLSKSSPLYICTETTSDGKTSSNLSIISSYDTGNLNVASRDVYVFTGQNPNNYVKYNDKGPYRIYYIDTDDSLILVTGTSGFGNVFDGKIDSIAGQYGDLTDNRKYYFNNLLYIGYNFNYGSVKPQEMGITIEDYINFIYATYKEYSDFEIDTIESKFREDGWFSEYIDINRIGVGGSTKDYFTQYKGPLSKKIHLKSCMKIKSGTGTKYAPYELDDSACK